MFNYLAAEFIYFATDLHRLPLIFFIKKHNLSTCVISDRSQSHTDL